MSDGAGRPKVRFVTRNGKKIRLMNTSFISDNCKATCGFCTKDEINGTKKKEFDFGEFGGGGDDFSGMGF